MKISQFFLILFTVILSPAHAAYASGDIDLQNLSLHIRMPQNGKSAEAMNRYLMEAGAMGASDYGTLQWAYRAKRIEDTKVLFSEVIVESSTKSNSDVVTLQLFDGNRKVGKEMVLKGSKFSADEIETLLSSQLHQGLSTSMAINIIGTQPDSSSNRVKRGLAIDRPEGASDSTSQKAHVFSIE